MDVRGAVAKPGVYELPEKSRVFQAVEAAGGLLPEALEDELVNQAAELTDGQQVYIPFEGEETVQEARLPLGRKPMTGSTSIRRGLKN